MHCQAEHHPDVVYVGIDLGCFKTSICCSNGRREAIPSAVGWPKDFVARGALGRDVVFGDDIERHRLALNVVRPFERGALKFDSADRGTSAEQQSARDAASQLLRQAIALVEPGSRAVFGVIGAPSRATLENQQTLLEIANAGLHAVMIVPEPFAVAYGMKLLSQALVIDIGAGTTDLCALHGAFPTAADQLTIPHGGDAIDDRFFALLRDTHPQAQVTPGQARQIKERFACADREGEQAWAALRVNGRPAEFDVTDLLHTACATFVEELVAGVQQLIGGCDPESQPLLLRNIVLAGGGGQLKGLNRVLERRLADYGPVRVTTAYDSVFAGAAGALKLAMNLPLDQWRQLEHHEYPAARPAAA